MAGRDGHKNTWLEKAKEFHAAKNSIGTLSSIRNALRQDVQNLKAWHLGSDVLMETGRAFESGRFAKALMRFAVRSGNREEMDFARQRLAEVEEYFATLHRRYGETDLTHFAARGDLEKVRSLLKSGVNPNERNKTNWTALHCVAMRGNPETAKLLVEHGADIEAQDDLKETPLITACRFSNAKVISALLAMGANVGHIAREKHTALWYAVSSMKDAAIVQELIEAGADANETYEYGDNPFLLSVSAQKAEVTNLLLPLTKDPARMNQHQVCALHFAASYNDVDLIVQLLDRGVDVDQATTYGGTALMSAAESNAVRAAEVLLARGADMHRKDQYGQTAISLAERRGHAEVYQVLTGVKLDPHE